MKLPRWKTISQFDPISVRCSIYATIFVFITLLFLALAFFTPLWLSSDPSPQQRFKRLGLWEACFETLNDPYYRYDRVARGCKWIFDDEYAFTIQYLEPSKYPVLEFKDTYRVKI